MKSNLLLGILFFPLMYHAQVGVNTAAPAASLDITAKNPTGAATNVDGLLIPRVDRQRAQSMTGVPVSTLIYVNSIATGAQSGNAVNVDTEGYYYYNGTAWTKLNPAVTPASSFNIYNTDGSLSSNRVVTQGGNTLSFTGTAANAFSVDGTTLSVNAANDRVGIGSIAPTRKLHVEGSQFLNAAATASVTKEALDINVGQDGIGYGNRADNYGISMRTASSAAGGLISRINFGDTSTTTADGTRYLSFSVGRTPNELMYLTDANSGRVGIGKTTPNERLDVIGAIAFTGQAVTNKTGVGTIDYASSTLPAQTRILSWGPDAASNGVISFWTGLGGDTTSEKMRVHSNGSVGIGTSAPTAKLSVSGSGGAMLSLTNTKVTGNPTLNIYPGYTSTGGTIIEGNQYAVVFDQDPGQAGSGASMSLYDFHGQIRSVSSSNLSDRRLKKDIRDLNEYGIAEVMKLQPKRYVMKEHNNPDIGFIAQELKEVVPEIVYGDESKGMLSVDYSKVSLVLVNAVKEQQKLIEEQSRQIKGLQADVQDLKAKL